MAPVRAWNQFVSGELIMFAAMVKASGWLSLACTILGIASS